MVTTIQVDEETQQKLFQVMTEIQGKTGRRISYNEALKILLERNERVERARSEFSKLYGSLAGEKDVLKELAEFKRSEKEKLEKKAARYTRSPLS